MNFLRWLVLAGILFTIGWEQGRFAPIEVQYATTPTSTSTWKTLAVLPAGDNVYTSAADNNGITRGRMYYFRARYAYDNGTKGPWSKKVGGLWLTGPQPEEGLFVLGKGDNTIVRIEGPAQ